MITTALLILSSILIALMYTSIVEWSLHRFIMHRSFFGFNYAFNAHAKVHHHRFKADETYHLQNNDPVARKTIPMAWWNCLVLIPLASLPSVILSILVGTWWISIITAMVISLYYATYEYIHYCMHSPKNRIVERLWIFRRLNGHHLLHHRYMHKNYNVVLPFADLLFGTLLKRSPISFLQAQGPGIPSVQPNPTSQ